MATGLMTSSFMGSATVFRQQVQLPGKSRKTFVIENKSIKEMRAKIGSVKKTKKICEAMKLVAAAKVRKAQAAVQAGRPFSENLVKVLWGINQRVRDEDVDSPLAQVRPVKTVMLVCVSGDRGLCGGYNTQIIKKTVARLRELEELNCKVKVICIGKKGAKFFRRREDLMDYVAADFVLGNNPSLKEATVIADELFSNFVSEEVDKVELCYQKFINMLTANPTIQTLLPLSPSGEVCNIDGTCIDAAEDEIFKLTTVSGKIGVTTETVTTDTGDSFDGSLIFEQDPVQILDALLPLYLNSQLLRSLQEGLASELAARMQAMSAAADNASEVIKQKNIEMNKKRQAIITAEIGDIINGAMGVSGE